MERLRKCKNAGKVFFYLGWLKSNINIAIFVTFDSFSNAIFYCSGDAKIHGSLDIGEGGMDPPFLDLCQSIEKAANKRSEKSKPLPCPVFPKLPPRRRHKSSNNVNIQDTKNLISLKSQGVYSWLLGQKELKMLDAPPLGLSTLWVCSF